MRLVPADCSPIEAVTRVPLAFGRHGCHPLENAAQRFSGGGNRKTYPSDSRHPGLQEFQNSSLADSKQHSDGCSVWTAALRKASLLQGSRERRIKKRFGRFVFPAMPPDRPSPASGGAHSIIKATNKTASRAKASLHGKSGAGMDFKDRLERRSRKPA